MAFFSVSTTSYPFMVLLNVAMCATGGLLGLSFLRQTLHRFTITDATEPERLKAPASASPASPAQPGALEPVGGKVLRPDVRSVFRSWMILFALVGAQMGWALRPFIGHPGRPFTFFRERESNFFAGVWRHFLDLFQ